MSALEIIYLEHSGFAVKTAKNILIFDFYRAPEKILIKLKKDINSKWIFSSHSHSDHFNKIIMTWYDEVSGFFLSDDIRLIDICNKFEGDKVNYMKQYETVKKDNLTVTTYGSTDEGVSFLVNVDGWRIFHAGDLNWWHWKEDTRENQLIAREAFNQEMNLLSGLEVDIAFFPVDSRLEEYRECGVKEFCRKVKTHYLTAMHINGQKWIPSQEFLSNNNNLTVWCPNIAGEKIKIL